MSVQTIPERSYPYNLGVIQDLCCLYVSIRVMNLTYPPGRPVMFSNFISRLHRLTSIDVELDPPIIYFNEWSTIRPKHVINQLST